MGREIRQQTITVLSGAATLLGTGALALAGWYGWGDYNRKGIALLVVGVLLACAPVAKDLLTIRSEARLAEEKEQKRALSVLMEITHSLFKMNKQDDLRVTLLLVDKERDPARLLQIARHENTGPKDPGSSSMNINQGVAGQCYREESVVTVLVAAGDFDRHMVDLGFTKRQARQFEKRGAYLCAPVFDGMGQVIAVLSMDIKTNGAFTVEHNDVAEWVTPFFAKSLTRPERDR